MKNFLTFAIYNKPLENQEGGRDNPVFTVLTMDGMPDTYPSHIDITVKKPEPIDPNKNNSRQACNSC